MKLHVQLEKESYPIYIEKGILFHHALKYIEPLFKGNKIVIISDDNVYPLYGEKLENQLSVKYEINHIVVKSGEASKSFDTLTDLYTKLLSYHVTRSDLIIALGGGVIGDLAGFVAATYLRGVKLVQIPTSLLAQVDSSVGGKVAVDLKEGKNLVGAFKHPSLVLIDPLTLKTLDKRYISDGMGEVIKYGCLFDENFFTQLESYASFDDLYEDIDDVIYKCVNFKRVVVEKDVFDFSERLSLNFGHTLAHAIEQYYHYSTYSHGEAVAIGMVQLTKISELHGLTKKGTSKRIEKLVSQYGLASECHISIEELKDAIMLDKKNINKKLSYVLLRQIGEYMIYPDVLTFLDVVKEV